MRDSRPQYGSADVAHALLRAAPRLVSAHGGLRNSGRDESRPGTLKPAPQWHFILPGSLCFLFAAFLLAGQKQDPADRLVERIVAGEQQFLERLRQLKPILETYIQEMPEARLRTRSRSTITIWWGGSISRTGSTTPCLE